MGFPWVFEENFELGTKGDFTSESDADNRLDFPGPEEIATGNMFESPFRGGFCMRLDMQRSDTDAYVESTAFAVAVDTTRWVRFYMMLGDDFSIGSAGSNVDQVNIFQLRSSGSTFEMGVGLMRKDPDGIVLLAQTSATDDLGPYIRVPQGRWFCVEIEYLANASSGMLAIYIDGHKAFNNGIPSAAIVDGRLGAYSQQGDFRGHIYFDQVVLDDERIFPIKMGPQNSYNVDNETLLFTKSGFAFIGAGELLEVQAIDGGSSDCRVKVFDTVDPNRLGEHDKRIDRKHDNYLPLQPTNFTFGAFVQLSGTNPQALVKVGSVNEFGMEAAEEPAGALDEDVL